MKYVLSIWNSEKLDWFSHRLLIQKLTNIQLEPYIIQQLPCLKITVCDSGRCLFFLSSRVSPRICLVASTISDIYLTMLEDPSTTAAETIPSVSSCLN